MKMAVTDSTFTIYCHTKEIITHDKGLRGVGHVALQSKIHIYLLFAYYRVLVLSCYTI